jgi:hypothetical protein
MARPKMILADGKFRLHADSADIEIETTTWVGGGVGFIRGGRL